MSKIEEIAEVYRKCNDCEAGYYPPDDAENDLVWKSIPALLRVAKAAKALEVGDVLDRYYGPDIALLEALAALEEVK